MLTIVQKPLSRYSTAGRGGQSPIFSESAAADQNRRQTPAVLQVKSIRRVASSLLVTLGLLLLSPANSFGQAGVEIQTITVAGSTATVTYQIFTNHNSASLKFIRATASGFVTDEHSIPSGAPGIYTQTVYLGAPSGGFSVVIGFGYTPPPTFPTWLYGKGFTVDGNGTVTIDPETWELIDKTPGMSLTVPTVCGCNNIQGNGRVCPIALEDQTIDQFNLTLAGAGSMKVRAE